jgi:hypothetical protein
MSKQHRKSSLIDVEIQGEKRISWDHEKRRRDEEEKERDERVERCKKHSCRQAKVESL